MNKSAGHASYFKIEQGTVYDPANGVDGQVRDLWIRDGKIVDPPTDPSVRPDRILNAAGLVVMPGGVDMHCHIAGPKVSAARRLLVHQSGAAEPVRHSAHRRSGTAGRVPSTFVTGYQYAGLGYTTAMDAAIPPLAARHAHQELDDTPCLDKGFYVLLGNNHFAMDAIRRGEPELLKNFIGWLIGATKAYAAKLVNPGGVEMWKQHGSGPPREFDEPVDHFDVTPRQIVTQVARAVDELRLPHAVHIHCNQLGLPGNWRTTLATMQAIEGARAHFTHIQFHSYGGGEADESTFRSMVAPLADYVNAHPNLTVDVGQVMFGKTISMTGDGALGHYLSNVYQQRWFSCDTEMEAGCGIVPIAYKNTSFVNSLQWAIGLEWYLMVNDPWRVAMSTDHPNGASFLAYPRIIRLLMDRGFREATLAEVHPAVRERTQLADLDREYSLVDIAIITRAGPARILGLANKGHLGPGADADITIYTPQDDKEAMFELPSYVIQSGRLLVEQGEPRAEHAGKTLFVRPDFDPAALYAVAAWFDQHYSIRFRNYGVSDDYLRAGEEVMCRARGLGA